MKASLYTGNLLLLASALLCVQATACRGEHEIQHSSSSSGAHENALPVASVGTDVVASVQDASNTTVELLGLPSVVPTPGPAPSVSLPPIHRSRLANGIEVNVIEHRALPVVHVQLILRGAGAIYDPAAKMGLANVTAELLRQGAGTLDSAEIARQIDASGSRLSTETQDDAVKITLDALPERLPSMLALLGTLIAHPRFDSAEFERLRGRELDRLAQERTEPSWLSQAPFYGALYPAGHPYGRFDTTPAILRSLTRDDAVSFHRTHYLAGSMTVVVVGAVTAEEVTLSASRAFAEIPQGNVAPAVFAPIAPRTGRTILLVNRPNSQQSFVRVGRVGPARSDAVWAPLAVSNQVLGAAPSSRLFVDLRERRSLTYGVYSRVSSAVHEGVVAASGSTRTETTGQFVGALLEHMDRLASEDVPEEELVGARSVLQNRFTTSIASAADLTGKIADLRLFGLPDDWFDSYRTRLSSVTAQELRASASAYFATAQSVIVVVGDARRVLPQLRSLNIGTVRRVN